MDTFSNGYFLCTYVFNVYDELFIVFKDSAAKKTTLAAELFGTKIEIVEEFLRLLIFFIFEINIKYYFPV